MWPLALESKKQDLDDDEPTAKECRICWGSDEDGVEEWVAPCRCPRTIAWVHRRCLAWRLKHTRIDEDKLRCAVCRFPYVKHLRLKSLREWFDGWRRDGFMFLADFIILVMAPPTLYFLYILRIVLAELPQVASDLRRLAVLIFHDREVKLVLGLLLWLAILYHWIGCIVRAVPVAGFRVYAAYRWPARFGLSLYKRFLAVAARDWVLDAPPPTRSSP